MAYSVFVQRQIMQTMKPILVEAERFSLADITEADIDEVELALRAILDAPRRIETMCVSVEEVQEEYDAFGRRLAQSHQSLADVLDRKYGFRLLTSLGNERYNALQAAFQADVPVPLVAVLEDPFFAARRSAARVLFYYAGFSMAGEPETARLFGRLAASFTRAIPAGHLPGRPYLWSILVRTIPGNPMVIAM